MNRTQDLKPDNVLLYNYMCKVFQENTKKVMYTLKRKNHTKHKDTVKQEKDYNTISKLFLREDTPKKAKTQRIARRTISRSILF